MFVITNPLTLNAFDTKVLTAQPVLYTAAGYM